MRTVLTTLKMAVLAPIPSASAATATAVKPGDAEQQSDAVTQILE